MGFGVEVVVIKPLLPAFTMGFRPLHASVRRSRPLLHCSRHLLPSFRVFLFHFNPDTAHRYTVSSYCLTLSTVASLHCQLVLPETVYRCFLTLSARTAWHCPPLLPYAVSSNCLTLSTVASLHCQLVLPDTVHRCFLTLSTCTAWHCQPLLLYPVSSYCLTLSTVASLHCQLVLPDTLYCYFLTLSARTAWNCLPALLPSLRCQLAVTVHRCFDSTSVPCRRASVPRLNANNNPDERKEKSSIWL